MKTKQRFLYKGGIIMMLYTILQLAAGAVIIMQVAMFFEKDEVEVEEA